MTQKLLFVLALAGLIYVAVTTSVTDAGHLASAGALLVAMWLALRTSESERPRLHAYHPEILATRLSENGAEVGVLVRVLVINLSRTANAVHNFVLGLERWGKSELGVALDPGRVRVLDGHIARLELAGDEWVAHWTGVLPTELPAMFGPLEARALVLYGSGTTNGLFTAEELTKYSGVPPLPRDDDMYVPGSLEDVHGHWYDITDELPRRGGDAIEGALHALRRTLVRRRRQFREKLRAFMANHAWARLHWLLMFILLLALLLMSAWVRGDGRAAS